MSDNKLVKTIMDVATLTGLATDWIAKKMVEETLTADPGSNVMNYVKFTAVMAGSVALKQYLEYGTTLQKIIFSKIIKYKSSLNTFKY